MPLPKSAKSILPATIAPAIWPAFANQIFNLDRKQLQGCAALQTSTQLLHSGGPFEPTNVPSPSVRTSLGQQRSAASKRDSQRPDSSAWVAAEPPTGTARHDTTLMVIREKEHTQTERNLCVDRSAIHYPHNVGKSVLIAVNHWFTGSPQSDFATEAYR